MLQHQARYFHINNIPHVMVECVFFICIKAGRYIDKLLYRDVTIRIVSQLNIVPLFSRTFSSKTW